MAQQRLWGSPATSPDQVVSWLGAVQAQEFAYARWSLAQRCGDPSAAEVENAYAAGDILRTHVLRPTWHFVHRLDLGWLMELSAPRVRHQNRSVNSGWGVDDELLQLSDRVLEAAVADGEHHSRKELAAHLRAAGLPTTGIPLAQLLMEAELSGILVSGTPRPGTTGVLTHTYAAFSQRVPAGPSLDRDEALHQLAVRYFSSRGPATVKDCAAWSGLPMSDIRRGLDEAADTFETSRIEGIDYLHLPDVGPQGLTGEEPGKTTPGRVDLVQCYDEYVMGYSATRFHLGGKAPTPGRAQDGIPSHLVLLDGQLRGHWKHEVTAAGASIHTHLFADFPATSRSEHEAALRRYSRFLGVAGEVRLVDH
nr:winged helix DNA-binding domain-containing protein [Arthrobacter sp. 147(2020)]